MWKIQCKIRLGECKSWTFTQNALFSGKIYTAGTIFHDRRSRRSWKISTLLLGLSKLKRRRFSVCLNRNWWAILSISLNGSRMLSLRAEKKYKGRTTRKLFVWVNSLLGWILCLFFVWVNDGLRANYTLADHGRISLPWGLWVTAWKGKIYITEGFRKVWNSQWKCLWV